MGRLYDYFNMTLTQGDTTDLQAGVAVCFPESCRGDTDMLPKLALTYIACATGSCNVEDLKNPVLGEDMNASFEGLTFDFGNPADVDSDRTGRIRLPGGLPAAADGENPV